MVTWHGGETTARPCAARRPYHARLASMAGAVMRWEYDGTTVVAKELRGASWVAGNGDGGELLLLRAEAQAKEEAGGEMRAHGVTGERWSSESASWPDVA